MKKRRFISAYVYPTSVQIEIRKGQNKKKPYRGAEGSSPSFFTKKPQNKNHKLMRKIESMGMQFCFCGMICWVFSADIPMKIMLALGFICLTIDCIQEIKEGIKK